ncbi:MAG: sigma-70 family RNA polymerase sigma factor [Actinobacteria bacterium]|nr:sigma-70 family RNA polymerase sigma factor [Actinomycetota bacterium]
MKSERNGVSSDRDLILRCRQGSAGAWHQLLNRYERLVYSIPLRYGLSRDDAADIAQITFTILIQSMDGLSEDSRLGPWLATVARRHTWRLLERNRRETVSEHLEDMDVAESAVLLGKGDADSIEHWELTEWLDTGLSKLAERCRKLLLALYFQPERSSYAEVAARLGMPVGSIGPSRARCIRRLKQMLNGG